MNQINTDLRALVIESDIAAAVLVHNHLSSKGFQVLFTRSGKVGLDLLQNTDLDVVVVNLQVSDLSAHEVLQASRSRTNAASAPLICFMGQPDADRDPPLMPSSHEAYFKKPVLLAQLDQRIEPYLAEEKPLARSRSLAREFSHYTTA